MGWYIETPRAKGKAQQIIELHGGRIEPYAPEFADVSPDEAIICILDNGIFEAAGFAHSERELERFKAPDIGQPNRPRTWVIMDRKKACKLTGYS